jgi:hypothetical protein
MSPSQTSVVIGRPDKLAECFEGLGDLCEFGVAQKFCGAEPLGLLRFASMPLDKLVRLLANRFEDLKHPGQVDVLTVPPDYEWWGDIPAFGIRYHAAADSRAISKPEMLANERKRVPFLARKLLEDLTSSDKIFLRRDPEQHPGAISDLYRELRAYGANDLFWVDQARSDSQIGKVEMCRAGFLRGYLGHYWPNAAPSPGGLGIWLALLDRALARLRPEKWNSLQADAHSSLQNRTDDLLPNTGWHGSPAAHIRQTQAVPPVDESRPVLKHTAYTDVSVDHNFIMACEATCFQADELYVASSWVWLPEGFAGWVGMMFRNQPCVRIWPADTGLKNCWQRIATSFRSCSEIDASPAALIASMGAGSVFYSTCWRVERGVVPADCLPPFW